jgi:hypothetical protein
MLDEYRVLKASWEAKKQRSKLYLSMAESAKRARTPETPSGIAGGENDKQIAERILSHSKL